MGAARLVDARRLPQVLAPHLPRTLTMPAPRPVGSTVSLRANRWDGDLPVDGDFLRTSTGRCYRILEVRPARPGSASAATFLCSVLDQDAVQDAEPGVFGWEFDRR